MRENKMRTARFCARQEEKGKPYYSVNRNKDEFQSSPAFAAAKNSVLPLWIREIGRHHLLESLCICDALKCATTLLEGKLGGIRLDLDGDHLLHRAARFCSLKLVQLFLHLKARSDTRYSDYRYDHGEDLTNGLRPLNIAFNFARNQYTSLESYPFGGQPTFEMILYLCQLRVGHVGDTIKFLSCASKYVAKEAYRYARKGKLIGTLHMHARSEELEKHAVFWRKEAGFEFKNGDFDFSTMDCITRTDSLRTRDRTPTKDAPSAETNSSPHLPLPQQKILSFPFGVLVLGSLPRLSLFTKTRCLTSMDKSHYTNHMKQTEPIVQNVPQRLSKVRLARFASQLEWHSLIAFAFDTLGSNAGSLIQQSLSSKEFSNECLSSFDHLIKESAEWANRGPGFAFLRVRSSTFSNRSNWSSSLSLTLASAPWVPGLGSGRSLVYFLLSQRNWGVMAPQKMGKVHRKVVINLEDLRLGGESSSSLAEH
ncbi:hypothetical protein RHSIM_Rhsim06G0198200 [Rhododendron simsii]|uniref:Uncharacterized protein n=1 Tax=Rhododendron simsii TaxID=118357 RepID=A0A834GS34_RHOSS|nr:hypothetical protein RHSIM_Rhsim06G0198200 [Rhododendron simsii]